MHAVLHEHPGNDRNDMEKQQDPTDSQNGAIQAATSVSLPEIVVAWKKAGAQAGWTRQNEKGQYRGMRNEIEYIKEAMRDFRRAEMRQQNHDGGQEARGIEKRRESECHGNLLWTRVPKSMAFRIILTAIGECPINYLNSA